jgi:cysteine desulfuration protein SufE
MNMEDLVDNFLAFEEWEDKYRYLIDLGGRLPPMDVILKTGAARVPGCVSQVWMVLGWDETGRLTLTADSDAQIVKGLIAVLVALYADKTREEAAALDVTAAFSALGLDAHLSPNRRNGFFSMVERVGQFISRCN